MDTMLNLNADGKANVTFELIFTGRTFLKLFERLLERDIGAVHET